MKSFVLVVDDDEPLRLTMCESLEDDGYPTIGVANGQEALDYLEHAEGSPCVIFLDLMMPVMNGFQFLEQRNGNATLASIPVVVVSANAKLDTSSFPATEIIYKPLALETLLETASRYCTC